MYSDSSKIIRQWRKCIFFELLGYLISLGRQSVTCILTLLHEHPFSSAHTDTQLQLIGKSYGKLWSVEQMNILAILYKKYNFTNIYLKCPYYGFLKMTFHAVCNTALSE